MGVLFFVKILELLLGPLALLVSFMFSIFLFWRASRYELVDSQDIFDVVLLFGLGALAFGRIGDFLVRYDFYKWSFVRLFFFNAFFGFDYYLAFLGGAFAVWFYLKNRKENFWFVADLAAAPIIFSISLYFAITYLFSSIVNKGFSLYSQSLFLTFCFFAVFWILKRLEKRKRHRGFFACFAMLGIAGCGLLGHFLFPEVKLVLAKAPYQLVMSLVILIFVVPVWYILAKRKAKEDVRTFFALGLLLLFKTKRVLFSVGEANNLARNIVLSPYLLVKGACFLVKLVGREVLGGFGDFIHALGIGK
jgi:hypothetical protein